MNRKDMVHSMNEMRLLIKSITGSEKDLLYNHAVRYIISLLREYYSVRSMEYVKPDQIIQKIVEYLLIADPESDEEFSFNAGCNDCIDILRRYDS